MELTGFYLPEYFIFKLKVTIKLFKSSEFNINKINKIDEHGKDHGGYDVRN